MSFEILLSLLKLLFWVPNGLSTQSFAMAISKVGVLSTLFLHGMPTRRLVSDFLDSVGGYRYKERRDHLLDILDIDLDWRLHQISDGERRRVCQN